MSIIPEADWINLGHDVSIVFTSWRSHAKAGLIHAHSQPDNNEPCSGGIMFDLPGVAEAFPGRPLWQLIQLEPLTVSPSLLCDCGHHGFIREGEWVPA